jgi:hypothetical protein
MRWTRLVTLAAVTAAATVLGYVLRLGGVELAALIIAIAVAVNLLHDSEGLLSRDALRALQFLHSGPQATVAPQEVGAVGEPEGDS